MENINDLRTLATFLPELNGKTVLQIGNEQSFLQIFKEQGVTRLVLIDPSQISTESHVEFINGSFTQVDLGNQT
jgi:hypothetical protein